jgi:hypothetical protein
VILAVDTGMATLGWALYDETRNSFADLGVSLTDKDDRIGVTLDRVQRIAAQAHLVAEKARGCSTVVIEQLSFPPGAGVKAICPISLSWGAVAGVASSLDPLPTLLTISPQKWQAEVLGYKADYDEIFSAATTHLRTRHPAAYAALERIPARQQNHAVDAAMMALCAGLRSQRCDTLDAVRTITFGPPCPHGEKRGSGACSQCRSADVVIVGYDPVTRMVTRNGVPVRNVDPGIDEKYRERARRGNRKSSKNRRVTV